MHRTNIYLADRQTEVLDRLAAQEGIARAELIRRLLDQALNVTDNSLAADLIAIRESAGCMPDIEDPIRTPGDREAWLEQMWQS